MTKERILHALIQVLEITLKDTQKQVIEAISLSEDKVVIHVLSPVVADIEAVLIGLQDELGKLKNS